MKILHKMADFQLQTIDFSMTKRAAIKYFHSLVRMPYRKTQHPWSASGKVLTVNRHLIFAKSGLTQSTLKLAMSYPDQSPSIAELARHIGVPERTLRTAFHRNYGVSPQEYLRIQRLCQARRLLRAGFQDQTTVSEIAFSLGFWDLGRFAGAYRSLFG